MHAAAAAWRRAVVATAAFPRPRPQRFPLPFPFPSAATARTWLGFLAGLTAGAVTVTVGAGSAVLCRPFDTPPYLIPYYLRDTRARFQHYASVKKRKGGPSYMNAEDFVLALLASPDSTLADPTIAEDLRELFNTIDANGDGFISFPEFRFLISLLTSRPADIALLFRVVDEDGDGAITLGQFSDVLRGLTKDEAAARSLLKRTRNGIVLTLFGTEKAPKRCTFDELAAIVEAVRVEVWRAEFRLYDSDRTDFIAAEQFSELLANQVLGAHLPYYIVENIRKLARNSSSNSGSTRGRAGDVSLDDWISFHQMMQKGDVLAEAVELYCASGQAMTRDAFNRTLRATHIDLPTVTVDIVFAVFDKDGDGTIAIDEFMYIMEKKISLNYQTTPRERKSLPTRLRECSGAALQELMG